MERRSLGGGKDGERIWARLKRVAKNGGGNDNYAQCSLADRRAQAGSHQQQLALHAKCQEGF